MHMCSEASAVVGKMRDGETVYEGGRGGGWGLWEDVGVTVRVIKVQCIRAVKQVLWLERCER